MAKTYLFNRNDIFNCSIFQSNFVCVHESVCHFSCSIQMKYENTTALRLHCRGRVFCRRQCVNRLNFYQRSLFRLFFLSLKRKICNRVMNAQFSIIFYWITFVRACALYFSLFFSSDDERIKILKSKAEKLFRFIYLWTSFFFVFAWLFHRAFLPGIAEPHRNQLLRCCFFCLVEVRNLFVTICIKCHQLNALTGQNDYYFDIFYSIYFAHRSPLQA